MTAEDYRAALATAGGVVAEAGAWPAGAGELDVQARWFAGEFGSAFRATDGRAVEVVDFGRWNREAGPDFVDARVRIAERERRGAIELDLDARDWDRHGHAANPAFLETVLHLFLEAPAARFFTRTAEHREVAQVQLPRETPPGHGGVTRAPVTTDSGHARALLAAAARHRLERKAAALTRAAAVRGRDEAWFAAFAVALGYKHNQTPFLLLAQRVGLEGAAGPDGEARLFGMAGFLEGPLPTGQDSAITAYLRRLWERWWTERARVTRLILPPAAWRMVGVRPANHPHRRVGVLAAVATRWDDVAAAIAADSPAPLVRALSRLEHEFWAERFTLAAAALDRPQLLVGRERMTDVLLNLYYPLAVHRDPSRWEDYLRQRGPTPAAIIRAAADRWFAGCVEGDLGLAYVQQGLLQIERDRRESPDPDRFLDALRSTGTVPAG